MCEEAGLFNAALNLLPGTAPDARLPCLCPPKAERLFPDPEPARI
jgi:hypothetical protein